MVRHSTELSNECGLRFHRGSTLDSEPNASRIDIGSGDGIRRSNFATITSDQRSIVARKLADCAWRRAIDSSNCHNAHRRARPAAMVHSINTRRSTSAS